MILGQARSIEAEIKKKENTLESTRSQSLNFSKILHEYNEMPEWQTATFTIHLPPFTMAPLTLIRIFKFWELLWFKKNILRKSYSNKEMGKIYYQDMGHFLMIILFSFHLLAWKLFSTWKSSNHIHDTLVFLDYLSLLYKSQWL